MFGRLFRRAMTSPRWPIGLVLAATGLVMLLVATLISYPGINAGSQSVNDDPEAPAWLWVAGGVAMGVGALVAASSLLRRRRT